MADTQPTVTRMVCLANSRMPGGRCIAGKAWDGKRAGRWIRPVPRNGYSWPEPNFDVLDLVDLRLLAARPEYPHAEDWVSDPVERLRPVGRLGVDQLLKMLDAERGLWVEEVDVRRGAVDFVVGERAVAYRESLRLIKVESLTLAPTRSPRTGDDRLRAHFTYGNLDYALSVTHPKWEQEIDAFTSLGPCCLTISLSREFRGYCSKLVAAILPLEREAAL